MSNYILAKLEVKTTSTFHKDNLNWDGFMQVGRNSLKFEIDKNYGRDCISDTLAVMSKYIDYEDVTEVGKYNEEDDFYEYKIYAFKTNLVLVGKDKYSKELPVIVTDLTESGKKEFPREDIKSDIDLVRDYCKDIGVRYYINPEEIERIRRFVADLEITDAVEIRWALLKDKVQGANRPFLQMSDEVFWSYMEKYYEKYEYKTNYREDFSKYSKSEMIDRMEIVLPKAKSVLEHERSCYNQAMQ